ncbi:hypothetical protein [Ferrovibrio sp.]|uniref:hypothetical protein n=1 Tax=Ferrovibrio sp. TaxID=1917215 RepID=UPI0025BC295A|nr:hypothetical protein [Ferrovibrio sp.]
MPPEMIQTPAQQADDDFLLDDGLPCLRRDGRLYYLNDVQPRVLEACRQFEISFDQLAEKLGMTRPVLLLILKGYDPVTPVLKGMIDRLLAQAGLLSPLHAEGASMSESIRGVTTEPPPVVTIIESVPVPEPPAVDEDDEDEAITVTAEAMGETLVPQPLTPGRPAASVPPGSAAMVPPVVFAPGLPDFTPGLRRAPRRRRGRLGA